MTSIGPLSQNNETPASAGQAPAGQTRAATAASAQANSAGAKQPSAIAEAATVSSDAVTAAQLLAAARSSTGIDQAAVQKIKTQIQSGTYNIPPDKVATSILTALNGLS
jgi:flagellar biosynthesis anti-sigma factor FlgM